MTIVRWALSDGVGAIVLDSDRNRNALSVQLVDELYDAIVNVSADSSTRALVISHIGSTFCSGADLRQPPGATGRHTMVDVMTSVLEAPFPVIARLAGPARAGGLGLAAACDITLVADHATFAFTEVRVGVIPAIISLVTVAKLGPTRAADLLLTGKEFSAADAVKWGLFTTVVPAGDLDAEVDGRLKAIGSAEPNAVAATKRLLAQVVGGPGRDDLSRMAELSASWFASAGAQQGIAAFAQRSRPPWHADLSAASAK